METTNIGGEILARPDTNANATIRPDFDPYTGNDPYIFISYAHADNELVNYLMNKLNQERFRIWYDAGLEIGNDFREELEERIRDCSVMIFFASEKSFASKYCSTEIIYAVKYSKKIYPFFLGEIGTVNVPSQLEMVIGNTHHIFYDHAEKSIKALVDALPKQTMRALEIDYDGIVVKCKDGNNKIAIPDNFEGRKVTAIGAEAFKLCTALEEITFGANIKSIGTGAFRSCSSLKEMLLSESIDIVGENAFRDCISLEKLVIERNIDIFDRAFENCPMLHTVVFPDDFAEVNNAVFNSCKGLKTINLPDSVIMIGESAFADCDNLERLDIPSGVIKINDFAFANCKLLSEVILNTSITKIGKNAFQNCVSLKSFFVPRSITLIENGVFKGCKTLEKIEVDPKNKYYRSFNNVLFTKNKSELIFYPPSLPDETYDVPDSVTRINSYAFYGCTNLKSINIPDTVKEIDEGAFYACTNLEQIVVPDSVVRIEDYCFRNCTHLKYIEVPDSVQDIGWGLFRGCSYGIWAKEGFELTVVCNDGTPMARFCDERGMKRIKKQI